MKLYTAQITSSLVLLLTSTLRHATPTSAFTLSMNTVLPGAKTQPPNNKRENSATTPSNTIVKSTRSPTQQRRDFMFRVLTTAGTVTASSCSIHGYRCSCRGCSTDSNREWFFGFGVPPATAFDREVGGDTASADTKAQNAQAKLTNARLAASGFKLDTREEEAARISESLSSFSYDSVVGSKDKSKVGKGYGTKTSASKN